MRSTQSSPACNASSAGNQHTAGRHVDVAAHPGCTICAQLADADGRYFGRLMRDARARTALAQTIATSMGFCSDHAALIASPDSEAPRALEATMHEAGRHLGSLLERTVLQDELLQDILFNARGRCPACAYFHRSEGRAVARVLHGLESGRHAPLPPLCFVHTQLLVQRTEPPLRGRLVRLLRASARAAIAALDTPATISAGERVGAVRDLIYPLARSDTSHAQAPCTCPVCMAIRTARSQWLTAAAENVRLEQPGWITLPTCRTHLLLCLDQADRSLQRAALQRYLEVALPGRPASAQDAEAAPKRRRRSKVRWFDAAARAAQTNGTAPSSHAATTPQHEPCPGCDTEEIAARRAIAQLIRKVSRANDEDAMAITSGVCLKHFAEALIYASDPVIEHRLSSALCRALRRDQEVATPAPAISARAAGSRTGLPSRQRIPNPVAQPSAG
ncbi:hypothetical protein [Paraburkholderia sp.]|uniref:hypothetical protein n=1 Tax=Paraburkholderia sp. TaxID=1926495 RepID=UPI0039E37DA0